MKYMEQTIQSNDSRDPSSGPLTIPTKNTGLPYGLLIIGAIVVLAGIAYAKFLR